MFILEFVFREPALAFLVGPLLAVAVYKIQLLLCQKVKHLQIKLIPLYLFAALLVFMALLYTDALPGQSGGLANVNELVAFILAIAFGIPFIGVCTAWLVHWRAMRQS